MGPPCHAMPCHVMSGHVMHECRAVLYYALEFSGVQTILIAVFISCLNLRLCIDLDWGL